MQSMMLRGNFDVTIEPKPGWKFEFTADNELVLRSGTHTVCIDRDELLAEIFSKMETATRNDDKLAWHISTTPTVHRDEFI